MEPRIQYAQTKDGVTIAYATMGKGPPLVVAGDISDSHVQLAWDSPPSGPLFKFLAGKHTVVKFDPRGFGLSDRDVSAFSLDLRLLDLEAVVDHLGLTRFTIVGIIVGGPVALAFAAQHPERVSGLALLGSPVRTADILSRHRISQLAPLIQTDWEMYLENLSAVNVGYGSEEATRGAKLLAASVEPGTYIKWGWAIARDNVTSLLGDVRCPTLVLHYAGLHYLSLDMARELTSAIQDSRMVVLEFYSGEVQRETGEVIFEFLGEGEKPTATAELPEGMAVLLFADIADSTALTEQLGDAAFRAKARELDTSLRSLIRESGGTPVEGKVLGDGVLAVFTSARQAIDCALRCDAASQPLGLRLHLGIHAGDVIREGNNVYGGAVNIAARIAAAAEPGEVLVSDTVRSLGRTSADVTFDDRGEHELKGVGEPQRLFAVRGGGAS